MDLFETLMITSSPVVSGLIWFVILNIALYIARLPAHLAITAFSRVVRAGFRLTARSLVHLQQRLVARNRAVLLNAGMEASERIISREFERMEGTVQRELSNYPALHRRINEEFTKIEDDYQQSSVVPPAPMAWTKVIEEAAKIPAQSAPVIGEILESIHCSIIKAHDKALEAYRKTTVDRHQHLKDIVPRWRNIQRSLDLVGGQIESLVDRTKTIAKHLREYDQIIKRTDNAERILSSSSYTQFFMSSFLLMIAIGGAMVNFRLIALPMGEMVGASKVAFGWTIAQIAALWIILLEMALGLFLMESLRITRLFPVVGALKDKTRVIMAWVAFGFLLSLASIEAGLAFMHEILMEDHLATNAIIRGDEAAMVVSSYAWITTTAQMGMAFILPFVLTFVAIPLESFIHASRMVLGMLVTCLLDGMIWLLRLLGTTFYRIGHLLRSFYDLLIAAPLWIERMFFAKYAKRKSVSHSHQAGLGN